VGETASLPRCGAGTAGQFFSSPVISNFVGDILIEYQTLACRFPCYAITAEKSRGTAEENAPLSAVKWGKSIKRRASIQLSGGSCFWGAVLHPWATDMMGRSVESNGRRAASGVGAWSYRGAQNPSAAYPPATT
jgi:hypothetical protein